MISLQFIEPKTKTKSEKSIENPFKKKLIPKINLFSSKLEKILIIEKDVDKIMDSNHAVLSHNGRNYVYIYLVAFEKDEEFNFIEAETFEIGGEVEN